MQEQIAKQWELDTMIAIIKQPNSEDDLDSQWNNFSMLPIDKQRDSNNKSLELFGKTNQERYKDFNSKYNKQDIETDSETMYRESVDVSGMIVIGSRSYKSIKIDEAKSWIASSMYSMIYYVNSLESLEELWYKFNNMPIKNQRKSDSKSLELFNMDNFTHYNAIKSILLKKDIEEISLKTIENNTSPFETSCYEAARLEGYSKIIKSMYLLNESTKRELSLYENTLLGQVLDKSIKYIKSNESDANWSLTDMPLYTSKEIKECYITTDDEDYNKFRDEWLTSYNKFCIGVFDPKLVGLTKQWIGRIRDLSSEYNNTKDEKLADKLFGLGWLPNLNFSESSRIRAVRRVSKTLLENSIEIVNMVDFVNGTKETYRDIDSVEDKLVPIFILLFSYDDVETKYTDCAISTDVSLNKFYSYKTDGFMENSFDSYSPDATMETFCVFVNRCDKKIIQDSIKYFTKNIRKNGYTDIKALPLSFNVDTKINTNILCSEIVSNIVRLTKPDVLDKKFVSVLDCGNSEKSNGKVYKLYKGNIQYYRSNTIHAFIQSIKIKDICIKESAYQSLTDVILENSYDVCVLRRIPQDKLQNDKMREMYNYINDKYLQISPITEEKEFPIKFNKDGDLLIKNKKNLDFEKEYSDSHRLLMVYKEDKNLEGLKYEVAKLWFLNSLLEKKIYNPKVNKSDKDNHNKARARILNDFNTYIKMIMKQDADFNFKTYYNSTPFCDETIKISSNTLKYSLDGIKKIILGL